LDWCKSQFVFRKKGREQRLFSAQPHYSVDQITPKPLKGAGCRAYKPKGEKIMMLDWKKYHDELMATIGQISTLSPDTVRGYSVLSAANAKTGKLDAKTRQLISLAVAVTTHCDGCITVHTAAAIKEGASKEEIAEALGVAVAMNAGAALVYSARVMDAYAANTAK
jgi:AhpD family alkylhydroperoxidase